MRNRPFSRIDGIGVPTHSIPIRHAEEFLEADPNAVTYTYKNRLFVFHTTITPADLLFVEKTAEGTEWESEALLDIDDFAVLYRPTDHEIVEALRGPCGPVGPQGVAGRVVEVTTNDR